jgi:hypothetical protein
METAKNIVEIIVLAMGKHVTAINAAVELQACKDDALKLVLREQNKTACKERDALLLSIAQTAINAMQDAGATVTVAGKVIPLSTEDAPKYAMFPDYTPAKNGQSLGEQLAAGLENFAAYVAAANTETEKNA